MHIETNAFVLAVILSASLLKVDFCSTIPMLNVILKTQLIFILWLLFRNMY